MCADDYDGVKYLDINNERFNYIYSNSI